MSISFIISISFSQNKKLPPFTDDDTEAGEVSEDDEEQDDNNVINGDYTNLKVERQTNRQGSFKRPNPKVRYWLVCLLGRHLGAVFV